MPELLESRNAPGAMLPLPAVLGEFTSAEPSGGALFAEPPAGADRISYRSDARSSPALHLSVENFVNALRTAEAKGRWGQTRIETARQSTELRTPAQIAAVNSALESFSLNNLAAIPLNILVPPPVIQPVEPPDEEPASPSLPSTPEAIAEPTPTGTTSDGASGPSRGAPLTPGTEAAVPPVVIPAEPETPPPVIQAVITDRDSEHNQPTPEPEVETPPPVIQPVITDPASEHNQEMGLGENRDSLVHAGPMVFAVQ
jgi:hypothetical protein